MPDSAFGFDKAEDSLGFLLWQCTMQWQRCIRRVLEPDEIAHAQFVVLAQLLWFEEHQQEATQAEVVAMSKMDKMTVSKVFKALGKRGLVNRRECSRDSRVKSAELTDEGRALARRLVPLVEAADAEYFGRLTIDDRAGLLSALGALII